MATLIKALEILQRIGFNDITSMSLDNNEKTVHSINHRYRDEVIVPYVGITNNVSYVLSKGEKEVRCADGVVAKVVNWEEKHICELEKDIQELYNIDAWSFVKRWWGSEKRMDSMHFIKMKLEKI